MVRPSLRGAPSAPRALPLHNRPPGRAHCLLPCHLDVVAHEPTTTLRKTDSPSHAIVQSRVYTNGFFGRVGLPHPRRLLKGTWLQVTTSSWRKLAITSRSGTRCGCLYCS